jgi:NAD(P)-dependent dehydrogenase (short-subunit alcohol dehydrogenase family)
MMHPFSYEGRRVVVTGGATGVGAALLDVLAEFGAAHVTVVDLKAPSGPHDAFLEVDLGDEQAVRGVVARIGGPVHVLFNNAGVADTQPPGTVLSVNYLALRTLTEALVEEMPEGGAVVNTASIAGETWRSRVEPIDALIDLGVEDGWTAPLKWFADNVGDFPNGPYNFSKEVVVRYTMRQSRPAMRRGVRMNSVCPGPIDTPLDKDFRETAGDNIIDWSIREMGGRPVSAREVALALAFLGSAGASFITGTTLDVDGGFIAAKDSGQLDYSGR